jgi:hypothetical protein
VGIRLGDPRQRPHPYPAALDLAIDRIPYQVAGPEGDNGSEFINHDVVIRATGQDIFHPDRQTQDP